MFWVFFLPALLRYNQHIMLYKLGFYSWYIYIYMSVCVCVCMCIPGSSAGKESACNVGHPGSTSGSGRSAGESIGYPLQYSWASLVI